MALRLKAMGSKKYKNGFDFTLQPSALDAPAKWKSPRSVFVNSMSDLFHEDMPYEYFAKIMQVMEATPQHMYQVLTKRPQRMLEFTRKYGKVPKHVWLGTSVEMALYKSRIDVLREVECHIRLLSCEPLLGPLGEMNLDGIGWVIVGGESGPGFRPMETDWVREIRNQCVNLKIPFAFKQGSGVRPPSKSPELDGRTWDEYPLGLKS